MKKNNLFILAPIAFAFLLGCSDDKHTNSWEDENSDASFAEDSFKPTSSLSVRLDIDYNDTLKIGDSLAIYFEIAQLDTIKKKDSKTVKLSCSEDVLCLDTNATNLSLFLGEFKAGSLITVSAATDAITNDTIRVHSEFGDILKAVLPLHDKNKNADYFTNFMLPGKENYEKNQFVVFKNGFYYLNLNADFKNTGLLKLYVNVDSLYYDYIGDSSEVNMGLQDTIRGISIIGKSPKEVNIKFTSKAGNSIDFEASGNWINSFDLLEGDSLLSRDSLIDVILLPEDSITWTLKVKPLNIENYLSGPYATFTAITNSRELGKGEYLTFPDSIEKIGEKLIITRERNSQAKYYLRQEQFVWLTDMKKGDSIDIYQEMIGYFGGVNNKFYTIVDKDGKELGTINSMNSKFISKIDGPVYLHYLSTCPYLSNDNLDESLTFNTQISYYGSLSSFFYCDKNNQKIDTSYIDLGTTIILKNYTFRMVMSKKMSTGISSNMKWFVPCEDISSHKDENGFETIPVFNIQNIDCKDKNGNIITEGEQEISSSKLIPQENSEGGVFHLIAESIADPLKRDTLVIIVQ